jgi:hypothetical protein
MSPKNPFFHDSSSALSCRPGFRRCGFLFFFSYLAGNPSRLRNGVLLLALMFFVPETPRWMMVRGRSLRQWDSF